MKLKHGGLVTLGATLAKAGEGTVHEVVGRPDWVVKIFHSDVADLAEKLEKVAAMVLSPPEGAVQSDGFVVLAWPLDIVLDDTGQPVGFVMPRIDTATAVEIHTISNPSNRLNPLPSAPQWTKHTTWSHLIHIAANLCLAVQVAHRVHAVIGDLQERNILVSDTARVSLVDCDSMQFTVLSGRQFLCGVGRPEFIAPELAVANLRMQPRDESSDLFTLAVHIHLLLMAGNHPFLRGEWTGHGEQPDALTLAQSGYWAGGPDSPLQSHPLAPSPSFLPAEIGRLFTRAFTDGRHNPELRPTAAEWRAALLGIRLVSCARIGTHQFPIDSLTCPWCEIEGVRAARRGSRLETAVIPAQRGPEPESVPRGATRTRLSKAARKAIAAAVVGALSSVTIVIWAAHTGDKATDNDTSAEPGNHVTFQSVSPSPSDSDSAEPPPISDADAHGFVTFGDGARCLGSDNAEMFMRTANSALVVCRSEIDRLYYRGYRISDGAALDLYDVSRQPDGFLAVNAPENARYVITSEGFQLIQNDVVVASEPAVEIGPAPAVPVAQPASTVLLGSASAIGATSRGYGSERPAVISMGLCANTISNIVWQDWGTPVAHGTGLGCIQIGQPPRYQLVASNIGICEGVLAYRTLQISTNPPQDICNA